MKKVLAALFISLIFCSAVFAETINYKNGVYQGQLANNLPHGQGILKTKEYTLKGSWYKGDLKKGKLTWVKARTIPGLSFKNAFDRYEGDFKNFLPHGNGRLWFTEPQYAMLSGKYNKGALIGTHEFYAWTSKGDVLDGGSATQKIKFKNNKVVKEGKIKIGKLGQREKREKIIAWILTSIFLLTALFAYFKNRHSIKMEFLREYNKKNKTKFETHKDLQDYLDGRTAKKIPKKTTTSSKAPLKAIEIDTSSVSQLGSRLKKLKKMYKDGILSKVEFEKAKNKLLK